MQTSPNLHHHAARIAALSLLLALTPAHVSHAAAERIGTFDSRAVAYAYFWSEAGQKKHGDLVSAVRSAKDGGDPISLKRAEIAIRDFDRDNHIAVFSTAPVDDALASLGDRLPALLREAGVSRLISKWDTRAISATGDVQCVDLTAALVAEFHLPPARLHTVDALLLQKPLPLERAHALWRAGKL